LRKKNEPKEIAPATRPFGLPGISRIGRSLWNSLALRQPQRLFSRFCDARRVNKGKVNPPAEVSPLTSLSEAYRYVGEESLFRKKLEKAQMNHHRSSSNKETSIFRSILLSKPFLVFLVVIVLYTLAGFFWPLI
jgi:hypothetical protein